MGSSEREVARDAVGQSLTRALTAAGWAPATSPWPHVAVFTWTDESQVVVTAELVDPLRLPGTRPRELRLEVGVGFAPAVDLLPLLDLTPDLALLHHPLGPDATRPSVGQVDTIADVGAVVAAVTAFLDDARPRVLAAFPTDDAIERTLRADLDALPTNDDDEPFVQGGTRDPRIFLRRDGLTRRLAVLLAVTERTDEALALLVGFPAHHGKDGPTDRDHRFLRQLHRWIDAGAPTPPLATETVSQLPPRRTTPPSTPTLAEARAQAQRHRDALDAARRAAPTATRDQLRALLVEQRRQRDLDIVPSAIEQELDLLADEPLGWIRGTRKLVGALSSVASSVRTALAPDDTPGQLRLPPTATYPVDDLPGRWVRVDLLEAATSVLDDALSTAPHRLLSLALLDVWLTPPTTADGPAVAVIVHLGEDPVGTVAVRDPDTWARIQHAAELFDELPRTQARLGRFAGQLLLEVSVPF